jgi:hypothetical protein
LDEDGEIPEELAALDFDLEVVRRGGSVEGFPRSGVFREVLLENLVRAVIVVDFGGDDIDFEFHFDAVAGLEFFDFSGWDDDGIHMATGLGRGGHVFVALLSSLKSSDRTDR